MAQEMGVYRTWGIVFGVAGVVFDSRDCLSHIWDVVMCVRP